MKVFSLFFFFSLPCGLIVIPDSLLNKTKEEGKVHRFGFVFLELQLNLSIAEEEINVKEREDGCNNAVARKDSLSVIVRVGENRIFQINQRRIQKEKAEKEPKKYSHSQSRL
jgi:hypothetical protein